MRLLVDTHFALWTAVDQHKLRPGEAALLEDVDAEMLVSAISIWELRLKWDRFHVSGDRKGPADPAEVLQAHIDRQITIVPLSADQAAAVLVPDIEHRDPFDRMLLIQAQQLNVRLLTRDPKLLAHPVAISA